MTRVVADTNVLVSAIIADGKPRKLLRHCIRGDVELVLSPAILEEVVDVLGRPKFKMTEDEVNRIVWTLIQTSHLVETRSSFQVVDEDPDDDVILHTAVDGRAKIVVSGDKHLLVLKRYEHTRTLRVARFLKIRSDEDRTHEPADGIDLHILRDVIRSLRLPTEEVEACRGANPDPPCI